LPQSTKRTTAAIKDNEKGKCDSLFVEINCTNDKQAADKERNLGLRVKYTPEIGF